MARNFILLMSILILSSCATSPLVLKDSYQSTTAKKLSPPRPIFVSVTENANKILGEKKSTFGTKAQKGTHVSLSVPVSQWLEKAAGSELQALGYEVRLIETPDIPKLLLSIKKLTLETTTKTAHYIIEGQMDLELNYQFPGGRQYRTTISQTQTSTEVNLSDEDYKNVFQALTKGALEEVGLETLSVSKRLGYL